MGRQFYVRLVITPWSALEVLPDFPFMNAFPFAPPDGSLGFLPVFESLEAFQNNYPGEPYFVIQEQRAVDEQTECRRLI